MLTVGNAYFDGGGLSAKGRQLIDQVVLLLKEPRYESVHLQLYGNGRFEARRASIKARIMSKGSDLTHHQQQKLEISIHPNLKPSFGSISRWIEQLVGRTLSS